MLRIAGQVLFVIAILFVFQQIWLNLEYNYRRLGIDTSFDFLGSRAGFGIGETIIDYSPNNSYLRAFQVGLANTVLLIAVPGIVLSSILGLIMGIGRLSPNWIVRKIAQVYVETLRNTPVLMVIIIMYVGVILTLPQLGGGVRIPGIGYLSNRGMAVTYPQAQEGFQVWLVFVALAFAAAWFVRRWRTNVNERTGDPHYKFLYGAAAFLVVAIAGAFIVGGPLNLNVPEVSRFGYDGGLQAGPELAAVLIALSLYTSSFIAEIIRGSIQAVSKGQKEAAEALGFKPMQQLRFVVLPQAFRIAIPPINSQYLNLTKNSSLAVAVGFPDFAGVSKTIINQSARSFQVIIILLVTYLVLSLVISAFMNLINRSVTGKGDRR